MENTLNDMVEAVSLTDARVTRTVQAAAPTAGPRAVQAESAGWIRAADGVLVTGRWYVPEGTARGVLVVGGAMAVPQRFYWELAAHLASEGWAVLTVDYRGMGLSKAADANPTLDGWLLDLDAALATARERFGALPLFYLGHSFGGQALGLVPGAREGLRGAVLVASQSGWLGHWPALRRPAMWALWNGVFPAAVKLWGRVPGWMGLKEDLPGAVALEWARWCATPGYLTGALPASARHHDALTVPMLSLSFPDDTFAPAPSVDEHLGWYTHATVDARVIAPASVGLKSIGHFGFFRPNSAALWSMLTHWLDQQIVNES